MIGWYVRITPPHAQAGQVGEVTGYDVDGGQFHIVLDGEERPRLFWWVEVRPV